jgi:hypothetical protein
MRKVNHMEVIRKALAAYLPQLEYRHVDMQLTTDSQQRETLDALALRWSTLRTHGETAGAPVPLIAEGLPLRARRLLDTISATTVQELLAFDPEDLIKRKNVGRHTVTALVARAEESLSPMSVDRGLPDFVEVVDMILKALPERAHGIIVSRFEAHTRSIDVARHEGISRERVRQIEEKLVKRVKTAIRRHRLPLENVLSDHVIEYAELSTGRHHARQAPGFYISLARAGLTGGDSYVDVERYYTAQLQLLTGEIRNDDRFILGSFALQQALEMAHGMTPALSELGNDRLLDRIKTELKAREIGARLIGRKPQVGRIIWALLRAAGAPMNIGLLVNQLRVVLGAYGEVSYFDATRLRTKLLSMEGVYMHDEQTVSLGTLDPQTARKWLDSAVAEIQKAGKPYSLIRFLDDHEDAPFDVFGLASLLRTDERVIHVGRRLYAPAGYRAGGPIHIAALISKVLHSAAVPMTRGELLSYVRERRDLISTQMEHYFRGVPGIVTYTADIVGLAPLDRDVMLRMLKRENCVASLLRNRMEGNEMVHVSSLWLIEGDEPNLSQREESAIKAVSRKWKSVVVKQEGSGLFFGWKEDK